VVAKMDSLTKK